jgi:hypothetical protein
MTNGARTKSELSSFAKVKSTTPRSDAGVPVAKKKPNWFQRVLRSIGARLMWVGR